MRTLPKRFLSIVCAACLLFSAIAVTSASAADSETIRVAPLFEVTPGYTVTPGTPLTLHLLPETFLDDPDFDMDRLIVRWWLDNESFEEPVALGTGSTITTEPAAEEWNECSIRVSLEAASESGVEEFEYVYWGIAAGDNHLTVRTEGADTADCEMQMDITPTVSQLCGPGGVRNRTQLALASVGADMRFTAMMQTPSLGTITGGFPGMNDNMSFEWFEADESGNPITGAIASGGVFTANTLTPGTRYYIAKGYYDGAPVSGTLFFTGMVAECPQFQLTAEPETVPLGTSLTATITFDGTMPDHENQDAINDSIAPWIEEVTGASANLDDYPLHAGWQGFGDFGDDFPSGETWQWTSAPVTNQYAGLELAASISRQYATDNNWGEVFWTTNIIAPLIVDANGNPVSPETPEPDKPEEPSEEFENVFGNGESLTPASAATVLGLGVDQQLAILRDGSVLPEDEAIATGDWCEIMILDNGSYNRLRAFRVVIQGDVLGTGKMGLSQVVRLVAAMNGNEPLTGVYMEAGDFNGDGEITLQDLVAETQLFKASNM